MVETKKEDFFPKWISLIKEDNLKAVLIDSKRQKIQSDQALNGIARISQLAYNFCNNKVDVKSSAEDILDLVIYFNSCLDIKDDFIKYFNSLYHIARYFCLKNNLEQMMSIYKIIIGVKNKHVKNYLSEGKTIHIPLNFLLQKSVINEITNKSTDETNQVIVALFSIWSDLSINDNEFHNGEHFLTTIIHVFQALSKNSPNTKSAVNLVTSTLLLFYKADKIKDFDRILPLLFQIYGCILHKQLKLTGFKSALSSLDSHLDRVKWKSKDNLHQGNCFLVLSEAVKIFTWDCTKAENELIDKINCCNNILKCFKKQPPADYVKTMCGTLYIMVTYFTSSNNNKSTQLLPENCVLPYLKMVKLLSQVMKHCQKTTSDVFQCATEVLKFISKITDGNINLLKQSTELLQEIEQFIIGIIHESIVKSDENAGIIISSFLSHYAGLIQKFHKEELSEEVLPLAKSICKFICQLPPEMLDTANKKQSAKVCFTLLICAFNIQRLDKVMECITMWVSYQPMFADEAFTILGDLKHNAVVDDIQHHLDTTIWDVISKSSNLERDWLPCKLNKNEIANLLLKELTIYSMNKSLRGQPVLAAADALLSLSADPLMRAKAVVIALDVASVSDNLPEECKKFKDMGNKLLSKLHKEKKNMDPVEFNCWVGNLMYMQLRCSLKDLRTNCETEMVKLSKSEVRDSELPEDRPDPNDTCDVNPHYTYTSLSLVQQRRLLDDMDAILRHWGFAYAMAADNKETTYNWKVTLVFVHEAGALLKLYFDQLKIVKVWKILYVMATLADDMDMIVTAVAEMLMLNEEMDGDWLEQARKYLDDSKLAPSVKSFFILASANKHLMNSQIEDGLNLLSNFESNAQKNSIQHTEYLITVGLYQKLKYWSKYNFSFKCTPSFHLSFHKAIGYLLYMAEFRKWGGFVEVCQVHHQLLKVSRLLGEVSWLLDVPREARCYLKSQLPLAQKLGLPLSTSQLLLLLAWVDYNTGLVEDCAIKLQGLEELLEISTSPPFYNNPNSSPPHGTSKTMLVEPDYLSHPPNCKCLHCNAQEYKRLVLETITLRASFCAVFGDQAHAQQCFQVAIKVAKDLGESNCEDIKVSQARLWLRYAELLLREGKSKKAEAANTKAVKIAETTNDSNLHKQAHVQQRIINGSQISSIYKPKRLFVEVENVSTPKKDVTITSPIKTFKTPKVPPVKKSPLSTINANKPITPLVRQAKIPFALPSSDEENTPPQPSQKPTQKSTTIRKQRVVSATPSTVKRATRTKTPFKAYDDDNDSSVSLSTPKIVTKKVTRKQPETNVEKATIKSSIQKSSSDIKKCTENCEVEVGEISKRSTLLKTYSKSKLPVKKDPQFKHPASSSVPIGKTAEKDITIQKSKVQKDKISNVCPEKMNKTVPDTNNQEDFVSKVIPRRGRTAPALVKQYSRPQVVKPTRSSSVLDEDVDMVEGTPSPPANNKKTTISSQRRVRSQKV